MEGTTPAAPHLSDRTIDLERDGLGLRDTLDVREGPDLFDPSRHPDLAASGVTPLRRRSSRIVAQLAQAMASEADAFTDDAAARIIEAVRGYAVTGPVVRDDLWWSVRRNLDLVLTLLSEQRAARPEELRVRRELGVRRARQGVPIEDVMRAFQVGYLVLWEQIIAVARQRGQQTTSELLDHAGLIWTAMHQISSAVADAYRTEVLSRDLASQQRALSFVQALRGLPHELEHAEQAAREVALDPAATFAAAVWSGSIGRRAPVPASVMVAQPDQCVLVCQLTGEPEAAEAALASLLARRGAVGVGVGVARGGLLGAQRSLRDAERAHRAAVALGQPSVCFRDAWLDCLSVEAGDDLAELVAPAVEVLRAEPELAATLDGFFLADGKLTQAAARLHVHANTIAYRLDRLAQRTGIDARTAPGSVSARLALTLARAAPATAPAAPAR